MAHIIHDGALIVLPKRTGHEDHDGDEQSGRTVDTLPKGHLRIATAFCYPDGSTVDLFIANRRDLLSEIGPLTLTDFGNTFLWLDQLDIRPLKSARRKRLTEHVLNTYGITCIRGALSCEVNIDELLPGIIRLGQACIRVADLTFTQRIAVQGSSRRDS
jgi:hypothetical protein